jgi:hypothetical protein
MPQKSLRKACDACSFRKVQCDGSQPCRRCIASSFSCTYLKCRAKPGPKGPRKSTAEAIQSLQAEEFAKRLQGEDRAGDGGSSSAVQNEPASRSLSTEASLTYDVRGLQDVQLPLQEEVGWNQYATQPPRPAIPMHGPTRIEPSVIARYLTTYESRAYSIWPVTDIKVIINRLLSNEADVEAYALATSLCAAMISQFQIGADISPSSYNSPVCAGGFEAEAVRVRMCYEYREHMTIWSLLSSFFLHAYAENVGKKTTSTVLLGEAITFAHVIGLHKSSYYTNLDDDQQQYSLRVYWLLFITERQALIHTNILDFHH